MAIRKFKEKHPDLFEFIMFNIMSNVATITNFIVLWIGTGLLFASLSEINFHWFIFNYSATEGGLAGFLSFLLAYVCAQIVNFIVQRKFVFSATVDIKKVLPWYILTVTVAGILSVWLPPYMIKLTQPFLHGFAPTFANIVNIVLQVVINYPMMKFKIMKKE
ncbi:GtrA family protein [Vagococcus sp. BWB3-3]|uniref:GtrA family protein n=1 Tax=Vagococcus allomyrinae TaxID=2794353 RepID=A0A940SVQ0_9ENTE|nr:GtrA family protein [Vagococcus allomyrinae]MBP1042104.1 GtrA family protein [Vagococcus allomyrinae]